MGRLASSEQGSPAETKTACGACAWYLAHLEALRDPRAREELRRERRQREVWSVFGNHLLRDAAWLDEHLRSGGFEARELIRLVTWSRDEQEKARFAEAQRYPPGSLSWQMVELERRGIASPDTFEKLAKERWGTIPEFFAVVMRGWRQAIAREARNDAA